MFMRALELISIADSRRRATAGRGVRRCRDFDANVRMHTTPQRYRASSILSALASGRAAALASMQEVRCRRLVLAEVRAQQCNRAPAAVGTMPDHGAYERACRQSHRTRASVRVARLLCVRHRTAAHAGTNSTLHPTPFFHTGRDAHCEAVGSDRARQMAGLLTRRSGSSGGTLWSTHTP
jgi:hypothetical protein